MDFITSKYIDNAAILIDDIALILKDYTSQTGPRIRFVLKNREKVFWCYPTTRQRDLELKHISKLLESDD